MPKKAELQPTHAGAMAAAEARRAYGYEAPMEPLPASDPVESTKKKNFRLRQSAIDRARAILGTATETQTIEQALELVSFRHELVDGVGAMRGKGLVNVFDEE